MAFDAARFLPPSVLARVTQSRIQDPQRALRAARARQRRPALTPDGKLNLLAADHPARRVTTVGPETLAMANRHAYLARILRVLLGGATDGVMATMDVLEDLLVLHGLVQEAGGPPFLDDKLLIASLNRGGLAGTVWELDDPLTGPSPQACADWGLDGAKLLLRVCDDDPASLKTMRACAEAISQLNAVGCPTFLEPLPVRRGAGGPIVVKEASALARLVGVASALGDSSRLTWLKLPYCEGFEAVARATTLPILLLGGEAVGEAAPLLRQVETSLRTGHNVRGALVGRNVLYPGPDDPLVVASAVDGIVHRGLTVEQAWDQAQPLQGRDLDAVSHWLG